MSHYPALEIKGLKYTYPDGTKALDGVDLAIDEGEKLGLLGPNGAGKSTLLLHMNGILAAGGEASVFGLPVRKNALRQIRQRVGLIFQNPDDQLFCPTVYDDVAFGPRQMGLNETDTRARVEHSLEEVGLGPDIYKKSAFHLSFGQKKLVSIATVLSMDARLLVFDEPSIGLDPRARNRLMALLDHIGRTQIIATHDLGLVKRVCTTAAIMHKGQIAARGTPDEILSDSYLLEQYELM